METVSHVGARPHQLRPLEGGVVWAADPSPQQLARELGVSVKTVRRRIADGSIRAYRIGPRLIRVERDSLAGLARAIPAMWR